MYNGGCFKCGKTGHWASKCTASPEECLAWTNQSQPALNFDGENMGGAKFSPPTVASGTKIYGSCLKCGMRGHFAKDCTATPDQVSMFLKTAVCDKCQGEGHRSTTCPKTIRWNFYNKSGAKSCEVVHNIIEKLDAMHPEDAKMLKDLRDAVTHLLDIHAHPAMHRVEGKRELCGCPFKKEILPSFLKASELEKREREE